MGCGQLLPLGFDAFLRVFGRLRVQVKQEDLSAGLSCELGNTAPHGASAYDSNGFEEGVHVLGLVIK